MSAPEDFPADLWGPDDDPFATTAAEPAPARMRPAALARELGISLRRTRGASDGAPPSVAGASQDSDPFARLISPVGHAQLEQLQAEVAADLCLFDRIGLAERRASRARRLSVLITALVALLLVSFIYGYLIDIWTRGPQEWMSLGLDPAVGSYVMMIGGVLALVAWFWVVALSLTALLRGVGERDLGWLAASFTGIVIALVAFAALANLAWPLAGAMSLLGIAAVRAVDWLNSGFERLIRRRGRR